MKSTTATIPPAAARSPDPLANATLCTQCGYCLPVCPTYWSDNDETESPRGRISLLLALRDGTLSMDEAAAPLSHCLLCRACQTACPAKVKPAKLIGHLRAKHPVPTSFTGRWFHRITDHPRHTRLLAKLIGWYQSSGLQRLVRASRLLHGIPPLRRLENLLPEPTPTPPPAWPPAAPDKPRVALVQGCMSRLFFPNAGPATANLLHLTDCNVVRLENFGCCGAPYRESGNRQAFLRQARATLKALATLEPLEAIVSDSAICLVTLKGYARSLGHDPELGEIAKRVAEKSIDLSSFLAPRLKARGILFTATETRTFTYHDHCQSRHGMGILTQPRVLLEMLPGTHRELTPEGTPALCCGAGGEYLLREPERSDRIRDAKLQAIARVGVDVVAASNPGCILHLGAGLREIDAPVQVRHLAELLWEAHPKPNETERERP
ncbi:Lactate utilization protein A [Candidatus Magnetaquicoccaceae bacterium FCR-1]|uniref:Glycolate oxidase iron-sulfur subunit n=1 Tax=Candidatus Magnetaquiglobus chichijimensis TaxID=3141448 RepID=A0ABQ0CDH4_9PROT